MKKLLHGLAALPFLAGAASAEVPKQSNDSSRWAKPIQLTDAQLDRVAAGSPLVVTNVINVNFLQTWIRLPLNIPFVAGIVAEDTAFQGVTLVTLEPR